MARWVSFPSWAISLSAWVLAVMLGMVALARAQQITAEWQQSVRARADAHQLDAALILVDQRLAQVPSDLEARGWRGRLLAWQGRWGQAEAEYRRVLERSPNDTDILCGLADVLLWQEKLDEALSVTDHARDLAPSQPSILLRRARILRGLNKTAPHNSLASTLTPSLRSSSDRVLTSSAQNRCQGRRSLPTSRLASTNATGQKIRSLLDC